MFYATEGFGAVSVELGLAGRTTSLARSGEVLGAEGLAAESRMAGGAVVPAFADEVAALRQMKLDVQANAPASTARLVRIDQLAGANYERVLGETINKQDYVYRYLSQTSLDASARYGTVRGYTTTVFSESTSEVMSGAQIKAEWGVPEYGVKIPVSELDGFQVARPMGDKALTGWEPFTNSYPEAGHGGWTQFKVNPVKYRPENVFKLKP